MNRQEVYNKVKTALLAQGCRSLSLLGGSCKYRGYDGGKCAVGHLIDDEHYSEDFEGNACNAHNVIEALIASGIDVEKDSDKDFLLRIQKAHDDARESFVPQFTENMSSVAKLYNLEE